MIMWDTHNRFQPNVNHEKKTSKVHIRWKLDNLDEDKLIVAKIYFQELLQDNPQLIEDYSEEEVEVQPK
jgi:hypothetical protein